MKQYLVWDTNPVLFGIGSIQLYWYGVLFVGSFVVGLHILSWIYRRENRNPDILETLFVYIIIGTSIGARLVHCFFYEPNYFLNNPLQIFAIWKGGLASHGGVIGVFIAVWLFTRRYKESYIWLLSRLTIPASLSATAIRIGNFMNSEIIGTETDVPWAVIFKRVDEIPRHPVQLYESLSYLLIFFLMIWIYKSVKPSLATKILLPIFFLLTFSARFLLEFVKIKQVHYVHEFSLSMGQMLSIPFILISLISLVLIKLNSPRER